MFQFTKMFSSKSTFSQIVLFDLRFAFLIFFPIVGVCAYFIKLALSSLTWLTEWLSGTKNIVTWSLVLDELLSNLTILTPVFGIAVIFFVFFLYADWKALHITKKYN